MSSQLRKMRRHGSWGQKVKASGGPIQKPEQVTPATGLTDIPVRLADLVPFARKTCGACDGKGERFYTVKEDDTDRPPMKSGRLHQRVARKTAPCSCGLHGFLKVQKVAQNQRTGQLFFCEPIVAWSDAGKKMQEEMLARQAEAREVLAKADPEDVKKALELAAQNMPSVEQLKAAAEGSGG